MRGGCRRIDRGLLGGCSCYYADGTNTRSDGRHSEGDTTQRQAGLSPKQFPEPPGLGRCAGPRFAICSARLAACGIQDA